MGEAVPRHRSASPADLAQPLRRPADLDPLLDRIGDARYLLLGEASHGTHEYYRWRAEITRRLVEERGFSFVAVEGDWPDCFAVNTWVRGLDGDDRDIGQVLAGFDRWPTWMWANREVTELATRLDEARPHRAIGVVYHPEAERRGNYVPTVLGDRYDAFLSFDRSAALRPLGPAAPAPVEELETFPYGV